MTNLLSQGSMWHRWDPHIHAPGTILNDGYGGDWEKFLTQIEQSDPPIRALGITDYYSVASYEAAQRYQLIGRLDKVGLLFPNVELRLSVGTERAAPVNLHLLVCPDDTDHIQQLKDFLLHLEFEVKGRTYRCSPDQIRLLGRAHEGANLDDTKALEVGTNQFKVDLPNLKNAFRSNEWARNNIIVAVAAGKNDGTAGLQKDASLASLRREIQKFAKVIFSGNPKDREFWLGQGAATKEELEAEFDGIKPCLHGSDAHDADKAGNPDLGRNCWLKGALSFETLKQACIEPEFRVFIGAEMPASATPSQVITDIEVSSAPFLTHPKVPLNPGLVGIIGARGSGKTALADFIAVGGHAFYPDKSGRSFIDRAGALVSSANAKLIWADDTVSDRDVAVVPDSYSNEDSFVRYLSQQFVDRLCSAEGLTDELLIEIQRVIYNAHEPSERMGAYDFDELLALKAESARMKRSQFEGELADLTKEFVVERDKLASLPGLRQRLQAAQTQIAKARADRTALVSKGGGSDERARQYSEVAGALQARRAELEQLDRRRNALATLATDVAQIRDRVIPDHHRQLKSKHAAAGLTDDEWAGFRLRFTGDVDTPINKARNKIVADMAKLNGTPVAAAVGAPSQTSLIPAGESLSAQPIALLQAEASRLEALIGVDRQASKQLNTLSSKINTEAGQIVNITAAITAAEKSTERLAEIRLARRDAYERVFEALIEEEAELTSLYAPLGVRIAGESGAAQKLSFHVRRRVDLETWAAKGEELLDLRKGSTLRKGRLLEIAKADLHRAWSSGTATEAAEALAAFRSNYDDALIECCPYSKDALDAANVREWAGLISEWLYSTDHIEIAYGVQYDGVDVEQLSPGTRGIVLLLLYLAIDLDDDRPLLIDQPEENLDPRSIFEELVDRFRMTKQRRQIIIVTHNANLIVNTDADQVIVASCGPHRPGQLPEISYVSGGLEDEEIRQQVCNILEGGESAFRERAKRLRVQV